MGEKGNSFVPFFCFMKHLLIFCFAFLSLIGFGQYHQGTRFSLDSLPTPTALNGKFKFKKTFKAKFNLWVLADLKSIEADIIFQDIQALQDSFPKLQVVLFDVGSPHPNQNALIKNWCNLNQPHFPVVVDEDSVLFKNLAIVNSPNLFVFNPNGLSLGTLHTEEMKTMLHPYLKQYLDTTAIKLSSKKVFKPNNKFFSNTPQYQDITVLNDTLFFVSERRNNKIHYIKPNQVNRQTVLVDFEPYAICNSDRGLLVSSIKNHNIYQSTKGFTKILGDNVREPFRALEKDAYAPLNFPTDVFADEKSIYISTAGAHQIWDYTANNLLGNAYAGNAHYAPFFEDGYRYDASLRYPADMVVVGKEQYFIDGGLNLIRRISGGYLSTPAYNYDLDLKYPTAITSDGVSLFVVDKVSKTIKTVNLESKKTKELLNFNNEVAEHEFPVSITYTNDKLYILFDRKSEILEYDLTSKSKRYF